MSKVFSLADLVPEPLTYRDSDEARTVYPAKTIDGFGSLDLARLRWLNREVQAAQRAMTTAETEAATAETDEDVASAVARMEQAATTLDALTDRLFAMLIPDLPAERRAATDAGHKDKFVSWWWSQVAPRREGEDGEGEAQAGG